MGSIILNFELIYIIYLRSVDGHNIGDDFPKYFKYEYMTDTDLLLKTI